MRKLILIPLLVLTACDGGGAAPKTETKAAATSLEPGLWQVETEVASFRSTDNAQPALDMPVGARATESVCVGAGDRPPPELFAGPGYDCTYGNYYMRAGRINVSLQCRHEDLAGTVSMTVNGTLQDGSFTAERDITTFLSGDGDFQSTVRLNGRRSGDCPPAGTEAGNAQ